MSKADQYRKLWDAWNRIDRAMREAPQDGQQTDLRTAARAIVRFEHENQLPHLKALIADHAQAISALEQAAQKLKRLQSSIASRRDYITDKFPTADVTSDAIDCLAWELSAKLGAEAVERLTARAAEIEQVLKIFVKGKTGLGDCILVEQQVGWDARTRESFSWLTREFPQTTQEAA